MGILDDAIREHLELKRRRGAAEEEVTALEQDAFGAGGAPAPAPVPDESLDPAEDEEALTEVVDDLTAEEEEDYEPVAGQPVAEAPPAVQEPSESPAPAVQEAEEYWLDEPDEVPAGEALDHRRQPTQEFTPEHAESEFVSPDEEEADGEDVLEATPDFLQETPEHDRLWFEQKPPKDFDFGG